MSDDTEQYDLVKMRTAVHEAETALARLRLRLQLGELIDRQKLTRAMTALGHRHRDLLLSLPVRHAQIIAAEKGLNGRILAAEMEKLLRRRLSAIAIACKALRDKNQ